MKKLRIFLRTCLGVFAGCLIFSGVLLFVLNCLELSGRIFPTHGDTAAGGVIFGPLSIFFGVLAFAWLRSTRSVLD